MHQNKSCSTTLINYSKHFFLKGCETKKHNKFLKTFTYNNDAFQYKSVLSFLQNYRCFFL
jgi:hypothetical protein